MSNALTTASILAAFSQEITAHGGNVSDVFNDKNGHRLFVRSTLPQVGDVKAKDRLQGGVALKAHGGEIVIHPYVFRLVCKNGAIMAQSLASRRLSAMFEFDPEQTLAGVREAVGSCCEPTVFTASLDEIRATRDVHADMALNMLPMLRHLPAKFITQIMQRFFEDGDQSRFGLMNAVTSVARDTTDPETKWKLEELGGGVPAIASSDLPKAPAARASRRRELALVS